MKVCFELQRDPVLAAYLNKSSEASHWKSVLSLFSWAHPYFVKDGLRRYIGMEAEGMIWAGCVPLGRALD